MTKDSPYRPNDHDPAELREASWWASRHGRGVRSSTGLRRGRRITLLDMLLLAVMAGVLVPWFLSMDRGVESGSYRVFLEEKVRDGRLVLILELRLSRDSEASADSDPVGWSLYAPDGSLLHEEFDLPPNPGAVREFVYLAEGSDRIRCVVHTGAGNVVLTAGD